MPEPELVGLFALGILLIGLAFLLRRLGIVESVEPAAPSQEPRDQQQTRTAPEQNLTAPEQNPTAPEQNRTAPRGEDEAMKGSGGGLQADIDGKADPECPVCMADDWLIQDDPQVVNLRLDRGVTPASIEVLLYICGNCGFVKLHSTDALKGS